MSHNSYRGWQRGRNRRDSRPGGEGQGKEGANRPNVQPAPIWSSGARGTSADMQPYPTSLSPRCSSRRRPRRQKEGCSCAAGRPPCCPLHREQGWTRSADSRDGRPAGRHRRSRRLAQRMGTGADSESTSPRWQRAEGRRAGKAARRQRSNRRRRDEASDSDSGLRTRRVVRFKRGQAQFKLEQQTRGIEWPGRTGWVAAISARRGRDVLVFLARF